MQKDERRRFGPFVSDRSTMANEPGFRDHPAIAARVSPARDGCFRRNRATPRRRAWGPIQRIGFHSLVNGRSRTARKTRLTSHIAISCGWPT
jgi:hypothetical protein